MNVTFTKAIVSWSIISTAEMVLVVASSVLLIPDKSSGEVQFGTPRLMTEINTLPTASSAWGCCGDFSPSLSPNGLELYFMGYNLPGGITGSDIWVAKRETTESTFDSPENLGIPPNSTAADSNPEISANGLSLFFDSNQNGTHGDRDIWMMRRDRISDSWGVPENLGTLVNTSGWEGRPTVSGDGLTLVFDRNHERDQNTLWMSTRRTTSDSFGVPVNTGISGASADLSADGLSLYFQVVSLEDVDCAIFVSHRESTFELFGEPVKLSDAINSEACEADPSISSDGKTFHFVRSTPSLERFLPDAEIWEARITIPELGPDFDDDGNVDVQDVDALVGEIVAGTHDIVFDLTTDGVVNSDDLNQWLSDAANVNGFTAPYLLGDTNLDGTVNAIDLNKLALNWRQAVEGWSGGDFSANGDVDSADLNSLAINWRESIPIASTVNASVPEPSCLLLTVLGLVFVWRISKQFQRAGVNAADLNEMALNSQHTNSVSAASQTVPVPSAGASLTALVSYVLLSCRRKRH